MSPNRLRRRAKWKEAKNGLPPNTRLDHRIIAPGIGGNLVGITVYDRVRSYHSINHTGNGYDPQLDASTWTDLLRVPTVRQSREDTINSSSNAARTTGLRVYLLVSSAAKDDSVSFDDLRSYLCALSEEKFPSVDADREQGLEAGKVVSQSQDTPRSAAANSNACIANPAVWGIGPARAVVAAISEPKIFVNQLACSCSRVDLDRMEVATFVYQMGYNGMEAGEVATVRQES
ncbi:uncharacterized protein EV420DRAFT_1479214 [Desarmillaria tabescens]|uniref:Uncharacterized protein n=1 Tax=Armillaria tabescens TaxID=1929756 RepID=A0AA39N6L2_ARMTA|nr:uncharacterized protein EV420DRAFT_1479214 [Desarmillaria tabescens]KAK0459200.1 hypothetical protein EV420DRAFT_1479214 [Desarmillaria tabescens]